MALFAILHASDLHLNPTPNSNHNQLQQLRAVLTAIRPRIIILSGDLGHKGVMPPEADLVELQRMITEHGCMLVVTPGNHDVDYATHAVASIDADQDRRKRFTKYIKAVNQLYGVDREDVFAPPEHIYGPSTHTDPLGISRRWTFPGLPVSVYTMSSADYLPNPGQNTPLDPVPKDKSFWVFYPSSAAEEMRTFFDTDGCTQHLRILVAHQPPHDLPYSAELTEAAIKWIHEHLHQPAPW
ncbi:MAG: metallophosphoesterase, partial [Armatimonadetes bacterium]|nr:metallophosphoesterase [Armatimonadota bacterium]